MPERTAEITSKQNPLIRRIKRLQTQTRARKKHSAFVVEGAVFLSLAIRNNRGVEVLLYCEALLDEPGGRPMVRQLRADDVQCVSVTRRVFEHVSQRNNPDGLAAIVAGGWVDVADLAAGTSDVFVCLNDIADPGNLGTILRTIDSAGASGCILVGDSTDPYHPRALRASRGSLFSVRVAHAAGMDAVWTWAHRHNVHTAATSARGGQSYWQAPYPRPLLFLLGSEHEGLDQPTLAAADQRITIPMWGGTSSLNVAVAASLLLYELRRRDLRRPGETESA